MEAINLDLLPGAMPPIVHVSQGDVGRQFKIAIYDDTGAAYSLTGKTLSIVGHKGDGNVFQYAIPSSSISGNEVTITTEEQMTPAAGKALCEIRIEQNGNKLGTANFVMDVEQGPADMGSLSISALYLIDALFERAQEDIDVATGAAATATQKASEASASATAAAGSASSAATEAGDAAASATAASGSASNASTSETNAATSETNAANSATAASGSATAADNSADAAEGYATAASQSASAASTSASNAATSETNAAASESAAATSETNADNSASSASTSATKAKGYATDAWTDASAADIFATRAKGFATDASQSASAASISATNATGSATAAANSATAATASESKIANMTASSQSVAYTQSADVVKTEVGGVYNLDFKIPRGQPTSGHDVEANPSGTAVEDITKLGIDGTIYNVGGGGNYDVNTVTFVPIVLDYSTTPKTEYHNFTDGYCDCVFKRNLSQSDIETGGISLSNLSEFNEQSFDLVLNCNTDVYRAVGKKMVDNGVLTGKYVFTTYPLSLTWFGWFKDSNNDVILPSQAYIFLTDSSLSYTFWFDSKLGAVNIPSIFNFMFAFKGIFFEET